MRRQFVAWTFLIIGLSFAICFAEANESRLTELNYQEGGISLSYPEGWYVQKGRTQQGYRVMITPESPDPRGFTPIVIDLSKYQQASVAMGLGNGTSEEKLNRYLEAFLKNAQGKSLSEKPIQFGGTSGKLVEVEGKDPAGSVHHLFVAAAVQKDVLATLFCEAPSEKFESYRSLFENIITKANPFVLDSRPTVGLKFIFPISWITGSVGKRGETSFETSHDPNKKSLGYIRSFPASSQSAKDWAVDEVKGLEAKGMRVFLQPMEIQAGDTTWIMLGWEASLPYQGKEALFKGEQYYLKDKSNMAEVFLAAPKEIFDNLNKNEIKEFLSTVQFK